MNPRIFGRAVPLSLVAWLTGLWMVLWGRITPYIVVSGLLLALLGILAFPLPEADPRLRLRPVAALRFFAWFIGDMAISSLRVFVETFRFGRPPRSSVVAVALRVRTDAMLTITALTVSAVPGSTIVEVRRSTSTVYLHALGADDEAGVRRARREVRALERRAAMAFGTDEERKRVR